MAKKPSKKAAGRPAARKSPKKAGPAKAVRKPAKAKRAKPAKAPKPAQAAKRNTVESGLASAGDALVSFLESPLATEILATGAAAGLAALTQHALSKKDGGAKHALKKAGKAAAAAMGTMIATEIEEIVKSTKAARGEAK